VCDTAIIAVQDLMALDSAARMNTPGQAQGNWSWRLTDATLHPHITERLRGLIALFGRGAEHI
jgi:4-alpha-glucanotransferase